MVGRRRRGELEGDSAGNQEGPQLGGVASEDPVLQEPRLGGVTSGDPARQGRCLGGVASGDLVRQRQSLFLWAHLK